MENRIGLFLGGGRRISFGPHTSGAAISIADGIRDNFLEIVQQNLPATVAVLMFSFCSYYLSTVEWMVEIFVVT